jgi:5-methylcytosine-specific restriction endonuclease McrA
MSYRDKCFREKGEICAECGDTENIEVHHIDGNRWNNHLDNLAPLCHDCHMKVHNLDDSVQHWIEQLDPQPPGGAVSDQEIDDAFDGVDL